MLAPVAQALFGLLSMHGWGSHTAAHSMAMAAPTDAAVMLPGAVGRDHAPMADQSPAVPAR